MKHFISALFVGTVCFSLQMNAQPLAEATDTPLHRSRVATKTLLSNLRTLLLLELSKGGAVRAINVCADSAQTIGEQVEQRLGVTIRRVSEKWRNPKDKPDSYEAEQLKMLAGLHASKRLTDTLEVYGVVLEDSLRVFRFMRPIMVNDMCLNCHGAREKMKDLIYTAIRARYPNDKAVDYNAGDLRGAVSVKVSLGK